MIERPACWIRGTMSPSDYEEDPVRKATQDCPHRKTTGWPLFGSTHQCDHPGALGEHVPTQGNESMVQAGGVDGYATFCPAVDMHLVSLGEPSRLYLEGVYTVVTDEVIIDESRRLLPPIE